MYPPARASVFGCRALARFTSSWPLLQDLRRPAGSKAGARVLDPDPPMRHRALRVVLGNVLRTPSAPPRTRTNAAAPPRAEMASALPPAHDIGKCNRAQLLLGQGFMLMMAFVAWLRAGTHKRREGQEKSGTVSSRTSPQQSLERARKKVNAGDSLAAQRLRLVIREHASCVGGPAALRRVIG